MRKLLQIITVSAICIGFASGIAAAADISNTGPGSTNTIQTNITNKTNENCDNYTNVNTSNLQNAGTGNADGSSNTTVGNVSTGDANNNNSSSVNVDTTCDSLSTSTGWSSTPPPSTGGKGSDYSVATTAAAQQPGSTGSVAALPNTGSDAVAEIAVVSVGILGGILAFSRLSVLAYRHFAM